MAQMINGEMTWRPRKKTRLGHRAIIAALLAFGSAFGPAIALAEDAPSGAPTTPLPRIAVPLGTSNPASANSPNNAATNPEKHDSSMAANTASNSSSLPTDHEVVIGAWGLGYLGAVQVLLPLANPVGRGDQAGMNPNDKLNLRQIIVPTLGLRKWFSKRRGFEAGLGLSFSSGANLGTYGSTKSTVDKESIFALSVHSAVPITVVDTRHMAFLIAPEARVAFATSNIAAEFEENAPPAAKMRGFTANVGLRAGAELHFGFMGLPRLSLQAGVALYVTAQWASASVANQSLSTYDVSIGMGSAGNPWDIFSGFANLSARYYF